MRAMSYPLPYLRPYGAQAFTRAVSASARTLVPRFWRIYLALWLIRRWRLPATPILLLPLLCAPRGCDVIQAPRHAGEAGPLVFHLSGKRAPIERKAALGNLPAV